MKKDSTSLATEYLSRDKLAAAKIKQSLYSGDLSPDPLQRLIEGEINGRWYLSLKRAKHDEMNSTTPSRSANINIQQSEA